MLGREVHTNFCAVLVWEMQEPQNYWSSPQQSTSYYPFGLKMPGLSFVATGADENTFTYNGKELEDEFGLDWYHYGARFYDPAVGRWWAVDPVDEFMSPYAYVGNNPVMLIDPNGMNSDCADNGCPPPSFWGFITEKIMNPINDFFSGMKDWFFEKNTFLEEHTDYAPPVGEKNILKTAGYQTAAFSDFTTNASYMPYISLSASKSDAIAGVPGFASITVTPLNIYGTLGMDYQRSLSYSALPIGFSAGVFVNPSGSPSFSSGITGHSMGFTAGNLIGFEYSSSLQGYLNPNNNTHQVGLSFGTAAWGGITEGRTRRLFGNPYSPLFNY